MSISPRNIKITIAYNGKNYAGWQIQKNETTIQSIIEKALQDIHKHEVKITGAGRTDSGVHACGQVANFKTDISSIPPENFVYALNSLLPSDIRILDSIEVSEDFNARYDAVRRVYKYQLTDVETLMPWERDFSYFINRKLQIAELNEIASGIIGTYDFSAFSAPMEEHVSPVRTVFSSSFYYSYPFVIYKIEGNGFLRKMVRSIVGTIIDIYTSRSKSDGIKKILDSRDRSLCGATAPARGLFLDAVYYKENKS